MQKRDAIPFGIFVVGASYLFYALLVVAEVYAFGSRPMPTMEEWGWNVVLPTLLGGVVLLGVWSYYHPGSEPEKAPDS